MHNPANEGRPSPIDLVLIKSDWFGWSQSGDEGEIGPLSSSVWVLFPTDS